MKNIKLTPKQLRDMKRLAQLNFLNEKMGGLQNEEFIAKCWTDAVLQVLKIENLNVEFPEQLEVLPDGEY